jgi:hypothetical protein
MIGHIAVICASQPGRHRQSNKSYRCDRDDVDARDGSNMWRCKPLSDRNMAGYFHGDRFRFSCELPLGEHLQAVLVDDREELKGEAAGTFCPSLPLLYSGLACVQIASEDRLTDMAILT